MVKGGLRLLLRGKGGQNCKQLYFVPSSLYIKVTFYRSKEGKQFINNFLDLHLQISWNQTIYLRSHIFVPLSLSLYLSLSFSLSLSLFLSLPLYLSLFLSLFLPLFLSLFLSLPLSSPSPFSLSLSLSLSISLLIFTMDKR